MHLSCALIISFCLDVFQPKSNLKEICTFSSREHQTAEKELNPEECQTEINEDEKAIENHEQELEQFNSKVRF